MMQLGPCQRIINDVVLAMDSYNAVDVINLQDTIIEVEGAIIKSIRIE
jgi:hypothetical protein